MKIWLAFISVKMQLNIVGFMDALHLRKLFSGERNPSFDALRLFLKGLTRKMRIVKPSYLNWGLKGKFINLMKLLDTVVKTETGKPVAKKYLCIKSKVCEVLAVYFLDAMKKEDKKESDYLSLSLSSTLQSTE